MTNPYNDQWRAAVRPGAQRSATALVPWLLDRLTSGNIPSEPIRTVVDVGSGEGWFVEQARATGRHAYGVDGPWTEADVIVDFAQDVYPPLDVMNGFPRYDLALCLEVAEHLPAYRAATFVGWLSRLAPIVVFSAAIPRQGGEGHVNEQWPDYWRDLFEEHGLAGSGALRFETIRTTEVARDLPPLEVPLWDDGRVEWWYRQNLLVFADESTLEDLELPIDGCPAIVHPGAWDHRVR